MGLGSIMAGIGGMIGGAIANAASNANKKPSSSGSGSSSGSTSKPSSSGTGGSSGGSSAGGSSLGQQMEIDYGKVDLGDLFDSLKHGGITDVNYLQSIVDARADKAQNAQGYGQWANDAKQQEMQAYVDKLKNEQDQQAAAWEDYKNSIQQAADQQQAAIQAGVDSAVANLNAQKDSVGKLTKANNAAAEKAYMQTINPNGSLAENLAANGLLSTGLTESSQIQAGNAYQGALNENALTETEAIAEIERAITQAQLSGDLQAAQALSDLLTQIAEKGYAHVQDINALNQWQSQFGYNMGLDNAGLTGMYNGKPTMEAQQLEMQKRQLEEDLANGKIDRQTAQKQLELLEQQIEAARLQNKYYQTQL